MPRQTRPLRQAHTISRNSPEFRKLMRFLSKRNYHQPSFECQCWCSAATGWCLVFSVTKLCRGNGSRVRDRDYIDEYVTDFPLNKSGAYRPDLITTIFMENNNTRTVAGFIYEGCSAEISHTSRQIITERDGGVREVRMRQNQLAMRYPATMNLASRLVWIGQPTLIFEGGQCLGHGASCVVQMNDFVEEIEAARRLATNASLSDARPESAWERAIRESAMAIQSPERAENPSSPPMSYSPLMSYADWAFFPSHPPQQTMATGLSTPAPPSDVADSVRQTARTLRERLRDISPLEQYSTNSDGSMTYTTSYQIPPSLTNLVEESPTELNPTQSSETRFGEPVCFSVESYTGTDPITRPTLSVLREAAAQGYRITLRSGGGDPMTYWSFDSSPRSYLIHPGTKGTRSTPYRNLRMAELFGGALLECAVSTAHNTSCPTQFLAHHREYRISSEPLSTTTSRRVLRAAYFGGSPICDDVRFGAIEEDFICGGHRGQFRVPVEYSIRPDDAYQSVRAAIRRDIPVSRESGGYPLTEAGLMSAPPEAYTIHWPTNANTPETTVPADGD